MPRRILPSIASLGTLLMWFVTPSVLAVTIPLYSNGSSNPANSGLATGTLTASLLSAPPASQWSELQREASAANAMAGVSMHAGATPGTYRLSDDFVVSGFAYGWSVSSISVFGYTSDNASFTGLHLRIWSAMPQSPGSTVIWDSAGSGGVFASSITRVYRVFSSVGDQATPPDTTRIIWRLSLTTPGLRLSPGAYWLDWQASTSAAAASALSPTVVSLGARSRAGANAVQFKPVSGVGQWAPVLDPGKPAAAADVPQDLPFLFEGSAAPPPCVGDADGSGTVNFADVSAVLTNWGANYLPGTGVGDADGDGRVLFTDVTAALLGWGASCH
ncbi:MAG: hypothetical protein JNK58_11205 [Phycisphaerae bacterium]|nr:hypothetical protein [Phycisphaerae bacterium]